MCVKGREWDVKELIFSLGFFLIKVLEGGSPACMAISNKYVDFFIITISTIIK